MDPSKPKLVLMPGLDGTGDLFSAFAAEISNWFETIVLRYPSTAFSYQELACYLAERLPHSERYALIAESFSTPLAIQFAAASPKGLQAIVLCAGFVGCPVSVWKRSLISLCNPMRLGVGLPDSAVRHFLVGTNASAELVSAVQRAIGSQSSKTLAHRLDMVLRCDARRELERLAVPLLYVHAVQDRLIGRGCLNEIVRLKPDVVVAEVNGPYLILQKEPRRCAELISKFLTKA